MMNLLNVAKIDSLLLTILIVLGVVVAGGLIVYLLWEVVMAVLRKNKKEDYQDLKFDEPKKTAMRGFVADNYSLDQENVAQDSVVAEESVVVGAENIAQEAIVDVDDVKAQEEQAKLDDEVAVKERENAERRAYLEARRQELLRRMQMESEEEEEEQPEVEETPAEPVVEEVKEEPVAVKIAEIEEVQEEVVEDKVEETIEETKQDDQAEKLEEERKALEAEKEKYAAMVRELEVARKMLVEAKTAQEEKEPVVETIVTNESALSLEEIKEKLALAEERLKATEKEFKQCKKEYIPLKRVWNTYEKDQKKLRRKEALVAKQKVLLYGVNNYADIDPDKANKLAEDLDLLDGLKLSVQHCEEVMKNNEERYPLLEKMYNVLKLRNDELKRDIAIYKEEIARIEGEDAE